MSGKPHSRNPAGLATEKPIALRLMPRELADASRIAKKHGLSKSSLARQAFLAGLPLVLQGMESA